MSLKSFANGDEITSSAWNAMIDDMPDSVVYCVTPTYTTFGGGGSSTTDALIATIKLRPIIGNYLFFRFQAQRGSGNTTADVIFKLRIPDTDQALEIQRTTVTASSWTKFVAWSPNLNTLNAIIGDASGADLDLEVYIRSTPNQGEIRGLHVFGSFTNLVDSVWQT